MVLNLGRTGSTIRARLSVMINLMLEMQQKEGYVSPSVLAKEMGLTDRAIRDYLNILTTLNILDYEGRGRYKIKREKVSDALMYSVIEPRPMITLEDFIDPVRIVELSKMGRVNEKIKSVLERINMDYLISGKLKDELKNMRIDEELSYWGFVGDKFVLDRKAKDVFLDNVYYTGSASAYSLENFRYRDIMVMSIVFISAASFIGGFEGNVLDYSKSIDLVRPDFRDYRGREPFLPGDPFYEMTSDFPELLESGRKIAARYLMEYQHLSVDFESIRDYGDKFDILLRSGSLVPHGFIVQSRHLMELKRKVYELFKKVLGISERKDVLLLGVSQEPHDNYIIRTLRKVREDLKIGETSDTNLMMGILEDGEVTCPVKRQSEKGRPPVKNWYEFYIKRRNIVLKVEMLSDNPLEDQERVIDILYSLSFPSPMRGISPGPSVIGTAQTKAIENLGQLKRSITMAIRGGLENFLSNYQNSPDFISRGDGSG
ncbi:MAG: hypothetical protein ACTSR0_03575 [Candidatus Asgardarchaeia archaeon]